MPEPVTLDDVMAKLDRLGETVLAMKAEREKYRWALVRIMENTVSLQARSSDLNWLRTSVSLCRAFAGAALHPEPEPEPEP
jgi:hypothetical protein